MKNLKGRCEKCDNLTTRIKNDRYICKDCDNKPIKTKNLSTSYQFHEDPAFKKNCLISGMRLKDDFNY